MLRPVSRLVLTVLTVAVPASVLAAPPPYVTGLRAQLESGREVRVSWDPSPDSNVVKYRLYYSSESILDSGGIYDDYEETSGPESAYVFVNPPAVQRLYVTVLAVNAQGEESEAFIEEVFVELGGSPASAPALASSSSSALASSVAAQPSSASSVPTVQIPSSSSSRSSVAPASVPTWQEPPEDGKLHLLLAEPKSPTQVTLTLSHTPVVAPEDAPKAFMITDPTGGQLAIRQIVIDGTAVTVDTDTQTKGIVYEMKLSEPLMGEGGLPLDQTDRSVFFTGHADGAEPAPTGPPPPSDPMNPRDVEGFRLRATAQADGTFMVTGQWQGSVAADTAAILVRQSLDGGRTFAEPQMLPPNVGGIQIGGARAGQLTVAVNIMNIYGYVSRGVMDTIALPGAGAPVAPPVTQPPVASRPVQSSSRAPSSARPGTNAGNLPSTGAAGLFMVGTSFVGAGLGLRRVRGARS